MQKYTAIILASRDIGEFDRLYIMYTLEQGLVKAVSKGVRKPAAKLAGHLEPGTLSEVYVAKARGMGQITGAITIENFERIKKSLEKLQAAISVLKFFTKIFSEGEKDKKTFDLLSVFLKLLNEKTKKTEEEKDKLLTVAFWWKLFERLGQRPEVARCVGCGEKLRGQSTAFSSLSKVRPFPSPTVRREIPQGRTLSDFSKPDFKNFFSVEKGGVVCMNCKTNIQNIIPISDNQIKLLRIFLANPLRNILKVKLDEVELRGLERIREQFQRFNF